MHYYQHHIGDFIKDTSNLTNEQIAVYLKMIWIYYTDEKPFANEPEDIAFAVRSDEKTVRLLLRHFFVLQDDGWHQVRCDKEINDYHGKKEKAKNSANARWSNANAMRTHTERNADATQINANQEPITNNQEPIKEKTIARKARTPSASGIQILLDAGISEQLTTDYLQVRKAKRAGAFSETALSGIKREAEKAGMSLVDVLSMCVMRGWIGFNADWIKQSQPVQNQKDASQAAARATFAKAGMLGGFNNERIINE